MIKNSISIDELSLDLLFQSYVNGYPLLQGLGDYTEDTTDKNEGDTLRLYNGLILHGSMIEEWLKYSFENLELGWGKVLGSYLTNGTYNLPNGAIVSGALGAKWESHCNS